MKPVKKTLLDTEPELSDAERVDAFLAEIEYRKKRLRGELVDEAAADEAFRRQLLDVLGYLGKGKRGRTAAPAIAPLIDALRRAGYSKAEIVEQMQHQFDGMSERQVERYLKDSKATPHEAPAKRR